MLDGNRTAALFGAYLAERPTKAFDWPANNCCHFAAQWVLRATGHDPMHALPATCTAGAAARLVRRLGGDLQAAWTQALQRQPIAPALARDGDLLLVALDGLALLGGSAVAVCSGRHAITQDAHGAAVFLPREQALCAWRLWGAAA